MFAQVITGKVKDPEAVRAAGARWEADLRPGAAGFLGATIGVTADGRLVNVVRFESREAAMANSARPEQGHWWAEFSQQFEGAPVFRESEDIEIHVRGDLDRAGFVQAMEGQVLDADRARALAERVSRTMATERPDILGEVIIVHPDDTYTELAYFTSEEEARAAEARPPSAAVAAEMEEVQRVITVNDYLDLRQPLMF